MFEHWKIGWTMKGGSCSPTEREKENGESAGLSVISKTPAYKEETNEIGDQVTERQGYVGSGR
jgi:hypothetical protein